MGDSKQRLVRFMFPKGHSGYREQDGSRGEGAKRESSEEPLDCGSEGGSVLRDAPRPSPPHWLARGSQQLERSRQVTTLFSWERCRARPGWLGRWGLWEARTTRQRRGAHPPPPGRASRRGRFERALAPLAQSRAGGRAWPQDVFCFHLARRPRAWNELQPITSHRVPGLQPADVGESPRGAIEERAPLRPPCRPASCELSFYPQQPSLM